MRHAHQMPSHLKPEVGMFERADPIVPPAVLGTDQFLEDIQVCGFDAGSQAVAHALWERTNLGNDPTEEVRGQQDGGRLADASRPFRGAGCARCEFWDNAVTLSFARELARGLRLPWLPWLPWLRTWIWGLGPRMLRRSLFGTRCVSAGSHRAPNGQCSVVRAWFEIRHRTT